MDVRIELDPYRCQAYGVCVAIAPTYFDLPAGAQVVTVLRRGADPADVASLREAVRLCPVKALTLIESGN